jgi:hypothetical protein
MALITTPTNLDYLIDPLRLTIGDFNTPYTYSDDELRTRLTYAVKALAGRWNNKYLINNDTNYVERNPNTTYLMPEPPLIQFSDERPIVLQAAIDIINAVLYTLSSSVVSWKDDEVSFSNKDSMVAYQAGLMRYLNELDGLLPSANNRLASTRKSSLPGFTYAVGNEYEG